MAVTYDPIATTTLGSAASSITFSSIPSTYTDLRLVVFARSDAAATNRRLQLNFNNDSGTNYSYTYLDGDGASASSANATSGTTIDLPSSTFGASATANLFSFSTFDVFSYAGSTYKTLLMTNATDRNGGGNVDVLVGLWRSTSAINRIDLTVSTGANFVANTSATLYGIKSA